MPIRDVPFEAAGSSLTDAMLHWDLRPEAGAAGAPQLRFRRLVDARIAHISGASCTGYRDDGHFQLDGGAFVGITCTLDGCEAVGPAGREHLMKPDDILIWRNQGPTAFRVQDHLSKLLIIVPEVRFANHLIGPLPDQQRVLGGDDATVAMISSFLKTMSARLDDMESETLESAVEMTLNLVGYACDGQTRDVSGKARTTLFRRVVGYIDRHLEDAGLAPARLADAHGISTRYLHLLFARQGVTVAGWIRERRLQRCREEIELSRQGLTLSEIAYNWGFSDVPHFSRSFKKRFGLPPRAWRMQSTPQVGAAKLPAASLPR